MRISNLIGLAAVAGLAIWLDPSPSLSLDGTPSPNADARPPATLSSAAAPVAAPKAALAPPDADLSPGDAFRRATEALAQIMIKNEMLEDAVGLYLQLGNDFPNVEIRDGKTGADFLTDLLTDRRLLPYLEPARYPLPSRVKAERKPATGEINRGVAFEV